MQQALNNPTQEQLMGVQLDISDVHELSVETAPDGRVWVNLNGICVLRVSRVAHLTVNGKDTK
jgi:hypothetical protein